MKGEEAKEEGRREEDKGSKMRYTQLRRHNS